MELSLKQTNGGIYSFKMIAEGIKKDEGDFNMESDENRWFAWFSYDFLNRRLINDGNCLF